jgi:hypothetical protein
LVEGGGGAGGGGVSSFSNGVVVVVVKDAEALRTSLPQAPSRAAEGEARARAYGLAVAMEMQ